MATSCTVCCYVHQDKLSMLYLLILDILILFNFCPRLCLLFLVLVCYSSLVGT